MRNGFSAPINSITPSNKDPDFALAAQNKLGMQTTLKSSVRTELLNAQRYSRPFFVKASNRNSTSDMSS